MEWPAISSRDVLMTSIIVLSKPGLSASLLYFVYSFHFSKSFPIQKLCLSSARFYDNTEKIAILSPHLYHLKKVT